MIRLKILSFRNFFLYFYLTISQASRQEQNRADFIPPFVPQFNRPFIFYFYKLLKKLSQKRENF